MHIQLRKPSAFDMGTDPQLIVALILQKIFPAQCFIFYGHTVSCSSYRSKTGLVESTIS